MKLKDIINRLFYTETGQAFISAIFGLSIAFLFKRVCKENCSIYIAPKQEEIEGKIFKIADSCYKYNTFTVKCNDKPIEPYEGTGIPENRIEEPTFFNKLFA
jgi:hypothetical protein